MKIEIAASAYTISKYDMSRFIECMKDGDTEQAGRHISVAQHDMTGISDWVKVGTAHITVELLDAKEIQNEQLASLQAQLQKERADSQVRQNAILDAISKLQALEWEGAAA